MFPGALGRIPWGRTRFFFWNLAWPNRYPHPHCCQPNHSCFIVASFWGFLGFKNLFILTYHNYVQVKIRIFGSFFGDKVMTPYESSESSLSIAWDLRVTPVHFGQLVVTCDAPNDGITNLCGYELFSCHFRCSMEGSGTTVAQIYTSIDIYIFIICSL